MSDLPEGKGRSPQIYTILNETSNICSCLFRLTPNADDGQIISKHCVSNSNNYNLEDVFDITFTLAHKCIDDLVQKKPYKFTKGSANSETFILGVIQKIQKSFIEVH